MVLKVDLCFRDCYKQKNPAEPAGFKRYTYDESYTRHLHLRIDIIIPSHRNRKSDDQRVRIIGCNAVFHAGKIRVCYRIDVVNIVIFREMVLSREKYFTMPLFSLKMQYL